MKKQKGMRDCIATQDPAGCTGGEGVRSGRFLPSGGPTAGLEAAESQPAGNWHGWLRIAVLLVLACSGAASAEAATFTSIAAGCNYVSQSGSGLQTSASGAADCAGNIFGYWGSASAYASGYGLGAAAEAYSPSLLVSFEGWSIVQTQFMISGPQGSPDVQTSLNFQLDAVVDAGPSSGYVGRHVRADFYFGSYNHSYLELGAVSDEFSGIGFETYHSGNIGVPQQFSFTTGSCYACIGRTVDVLFPVNTPLNIEIWLRAWAQAELEGYGWANAYNTLYFPLNGPVFNLPEGYSAVIYGMNVEGNRVVGRDNGGGGGGEIPEPGTMAMMAAGLLALGAAARARRRAEFDSGGIDMGKQRSTVDRTAVQGHFGVIRSRAAASGGDGPSAEARAGPGWLRMAVLLMVLACGGAASAEAAVFTAAASGCSYDFGTGPGSQNVATGRSDCTGGYAYGSANAQANGFGLHAYAEGYQYCCASASGFAASARVETQYMIIGPQGSPDVPISLNFVLSGSVGGGSTPGYSGRFVRADLILEYAGWYFIEFGENSNGPDGFSYWYSSNLSGPSNYLPGACIRCRAATLQATVPVNRPLSFYMGLQAWVGQFGDAYGYADASNTLYFPLDGPVFNLPEGYSAVIYGMNVEGNRVVGLDNGGGEIPEPGTMAMMAAGLLALGATARARRRSGLCRE